MHDAKLTAALEMLYHFMLIPPIHHIRGKKRSKLDHRMSLAAGVRHHQYHAKMEQRMRNVNLAHALPFPFAAQMLTRVK